MTVTRRPDAGGPTSCRISLTMRVDPAETASRYIPSAEITSVCERWRGGGGDVGDLWPAGGGAIVGAGGSWPCFPARRRVRDGLGAGGSLTPGAERGGGGRPPAAFDAGQVRIFQNGEFRGGGTLVDRNWVLTVGAPVPPSRQSQHLRVEVRRRHQSERPERPDECPVDRQDRAGGGRRGYGAFRRPRSAGHLDPFARHRPPARFADGVLYGWGPYGTVLNRGLGVVYDPVASENAAYLRSEDPVFAADFPAGVQPMVTTIRAQVGDSGSGVFSPWGVLAGVHYGGGAISARQRFGTAFWR